MADKKKKHQPEVRKSKMPSVFNFLQMTGTHTGHSRNNRKNSPTERQIGRNQISRFILNPRKFRGGPAARKK